MGKKRVSRSEHDRRLARRRATGRPRQTRAVRHDIQSSALTVAQLASDVREEIDILKAEIDAGQRTLEEKERFLANLLSAAGIQRAILYLTDVNEYEGEDLERISQGVTPETLAREWGVR